MGNFYDVFFVLKRSLAAEPMNSHLCNGQISLITSYSFTIECKLVLNSDNEPCSVLQMLHDFCYTAPPGSRICVSTLQYARAKIINNFLVVLDFLNLRGYCASCKRICIEPTRSIWFSKWSRQSAWNNKIFELWKSYLIYYNRRS